MSNLCQEITFPTYPINHIDHEVGVIALCILSAVNVGKIKSDEELGELCELSVRGLEELIDYQKYPVRAAERATRARRSLGVGFIGLAHYLAKLGFNYDSQEAWDAVHGLSESFQYYLLKSSNQIAKEKGHCSGFGRTKYAVGILPIDTYKKDVDEISSIELQHDWESLRASNFELAWPRLCQEIGQDFYRFWRYYLLSCAGYFRSRQGQLWQLVLSRADRQSTYRSIRPSSDEWISTASPQDAADSGQECCIN